MRSATSHRNAAAPRAASEAIAEKVMHHVMNEPIMNEMTGKAKPKAAKLLFFDEARKIEVGAVTLQLGRGYDIAEEPRRGGRRAH
jgi:hypothetical protein